MTTTIHDKSSRQLKMPSQPTVFSNKMPEGLDRGIEPRPKGRVCEEKKDKRSQLWKIFILLYASALTPPEKTLLKREPVQLQMLDKNQAFYKVPAKDEMEREKISLEKYG